MNDKAESTIQRPGWNKKQVNNIDTKKIRLRSYAWCKQKKKKKCIFFNKQNEFNKYIRQHKVTKLVNP